MSRVVKTHHVDQHTLADLAARAWDRNPRRHDLEALGASLGKFGYAQPILIDDTSGRIVAGHGVLASLLLAQEDGHTPPLRVTVQGAEWSVAAIHFRLAEGEADGYSIADTRTRELGGWHDDLLLAVLQDLAELDPTLAGTGFTAEDLTVLQQKIGGALPASFTEVPDPTDPTRSLRTVTCPHCGEAFQA
ncbi:hypothetical protein [Deinococcus rufus]|uniref:ParB/Sulfiredoxin domain-containing protein n=1 Tax=Deinococcus rufus TaxID=2136097 RepID=A0ABV7Z7T7_9DEIO